MSLDSGEVVALLGTVLAAALGAVYAYGEIRERQRLRWLILSLIAGYPAVHLLVTVVVWRNHFAFPLNLEAMELAMKTSDCV